MFPQHFPQLIFQQGACAPGPLQSPMRAENYWSQLQASCYPPGEMGAIKITKLS